MYEVSVELFPYESEPVKMIAKVESASVQSNTESESAKLNVAQLSELK